MPNYLNYIADFLNDGFVNCVPILDNLGEIDYYLENVNADSVDIGVRIATDEEPTFSFYTSRLGIRYKDVDNLYLEKSNQIRGLN